MDGRDLHAAFSPAVLPWRRWRSRTDLVAARRRPDSDRPAQPLVAAAPPDRPSLRSCSRSGCSPGSLLALGRGDHRPHSWSSRLVQPARVAVELGRLAGRPTMAAPGRGDRPSPALLGGGPASSPRRDCSHALAQPEANRARVRGGTLPGPVPLNTRAIRRQLGLLRALRERLGDFSRPVSARGMLLVDRLLTGPGSPLYSRVPDARSPSADRGLAAIDPEPSAAAA